MVIKEKFQFTYYPIELAEIDITICSIDFVNFIYFIK